MHHAIAVWLTARPWRAAIAAGFCGVLSLLIPLPFALPLPFLVPAGAIPVLVALRSDPRQALLVAATAAAPALWMVLPFAHTMPGVIVAVLALMFAPVGLALVLRRTGSLNLCFQLAVAGAAAAVVLIHVLLPDPAAFWVEVINRAVQSAKDTGLLQRNAELDAAIAAAVTVWARTMWGAAIATALVTVLSALFLGCWWQTLLEAPGQFGAEYRRLRLGRVLGLVVTALFVGAFMVDSALIGSLAWIALVALTVQGLAAAHRSKASGRLKRGWLAAIYVFLIGPLPLSTAITALALAAWGLADNWLRPRVPAV
ncbi:MAG TPA: hypothetical protein VKB34_13500 [Povalibacter sp.]|nr:hypothetical protein [Povalibacter sp.]